MEPRGIPHLPQQRANRRSQAVTRMQGSFGSGASSQNTLANAHGHLPAVSAGESPGGTIRGGGTAQAEAVAQLARQMAANPGVQQLLARPQLLQQAMAADPGLRALVASNPALGALLAPDKLAQLGGVLEQLAAADSAGHGGSPEDSVGSWGQSARRGAARGTLPPLADLLTMAPQQAATPSDLTANRRVRISLLLMCMF
jgi:hypothetical protein